MPVRIEILDLVRILSWLADNLKAYHSIFLQDQDVRLIGMASRNLNIRRPFEPVDC